MGYQARGAVAVIFASNGAERPFGYHHDRAPPGMVKHFFMLQFVIQWPLFTNLVCHCFWVPLLFHLVLISIFVKLWFAAASMARYPCLHGEFQLCWWTLQRLGHEPDLAAPDGHSHIAGAGLSWGWSWPWRRNGFSPGSQLGKRQRLRNAIVWIVEYILWYMIDILDAILRDLYSWSLWTMENQM